MLLPALADPNNRVRANVMVALRGAAETAVAAALAEMVDSGEERTQISALYAMSELEDEAFLPQLERLRRSPSPEVAERAARLLERLFGEGLAEHRKVRVFVSSTFRDMHAERDHRVTVVYPELRERLLPRIHIGCAVLPRHASKCPRQGACPLLLDPLLLDRGQGW